MLDSEPSLVAIAPGSATQRHQQLLRLETGVCHHFQQGLLFQFYLIVIIDMLQATAAANLKGFAARRDTQR